MSSATHRKSSNHTNPDFNISHNNNNKFFFFRNKTLMFAFLNLEKNLEWYRRLLIQTLAEPRELNINPKNCIGTVLSLNGHRKYFCMYHAKYRENFKPGVTVKYRSGIS